MEGERCPRNGMCLFTNRFPTLSVGDLAHGHRGPGGNAA
jgi:hypothetical protein